MGMKIKQVRLNFVEIFRLSGWSLKMLWRISGKFTLGYVATSIAQVAIELTQLWVAAMIVGKLGALMISQVPADGLVLLVGLSISLMALDKIAWNLLAHFERKLYLSGSASVYYDFNRQLASLSIAQSNDTKIRQLIDRLTQEGYNWKTLNFGFYILYGLHALVRFLGSCFILLTQLPAIVLLLIVSTIPTLFIQRKSGDYGWGIWGEVGDKSRVFWGVSYLFQSRQALEEIKPQRSSGFLLDRAMRAINEYTQKSIVVRNRFFKLSIFGAIFEVVVSGLGYIWLVLKAVAGKISFDNFVFMSSLLWQTLSSIRLVATQLADLLYAVPFMKDYVKFMELENDLEMPDNPIKLGSEQLSIEFRNVSFSYPESKRRVLNNISFKIDPKEQLAIVGHNGSGKSTLIRLLMRFYDPSEGEILVNGHNLKDIDLDAYYKHIGTLFQEYNKYPLSFKDNIALEKMADKTKFESVLDIADANSVLNKLDDENVFLRPDFEDGVDLSGGEWQKVAIARNLYSGRDVFIMDEPTSSIDSLSEQKIFEKLYKELTGKMLITISHRFNTVKKAKNIIVLEKGRLVERGTHSELMDKDGLYKEMFDAQAEGFR